MGTEANYLKRAQNLFILFQNNHGLDIKNEPERTCELIRDHCKDKAPATWRQVKASVMHYAKIHKLNELLQHLEPMEVEDGSASIPDRTSAMKKKSVTLGERDLINEVIIKKVRAPQPNYWYKPLFAFFNAGLAIGLRPCEWQSALWHDNPISGVDLTPPILRVKNAKSTNGRSFDQYRYIGLSRLSEKQILYVKIALTFAHNPTTIDGNEIPWEVFYKRMRSRLLTITTNLFPRAKRNISLYSTRHQLIADLKASGISLPEIALIVGHGNDLTASEHYGKKNCGKANGHLPKANLADIDKVKTLFKTFTPSKAVHKPVMP